MSLTNRIVAGASTAAALGVGVFLGINSTAASERRVEALLTRQVPAQVAQERALAREHNSAGTTGYFKVQLDTDLKAHALPPMTTDALGQPNRYAHPVTRPKKIKVGAKTRFDQLEFSISRPKIAAQQRGMSVKRTHTIVTLKNLGDAPVAYFLKIKATGEGSCESMRKHNAMALRPGESADVLACPGKRGVELTDLQVLEITPIGYVYVSQVPPIAAGYDAVVARAHTQAKGAAQCSRLASERLATRISSGEIEWQDVVDFFSRHNCANHGFPAGYRMTTQPVSKFPIDALIP